MEVVRKKNFEFSRSTQRCYVSLYEYPTNWQLGLRMRFTKEAARLADFTLGVHINFLNDGNIWHFYVDTSGFPLTRNDAGVWFLNHAGLVNMFMKSTGFQSGDQLLVEKTNCELEGKKLFKINTTMTMVQHRIAWEDLMRERRTNLAMALRNRLCPKSAKHVN